MSDAPEKKAGNRSDAAEENVFDWARREGVEAGVLSDLEGLLRKRRRRRRALVSMGAVLVVAGLSWSLREPATTDGPARAVVLRPEVRTLPDGTVVELNAGAEIGVDFAGPLRRVVLVRGEGHFSVTSDPGRPFVVEAGEIEVRAIGTAFAVERGSGRVDVLVTEGKVAVERLPDRAGETHAPDDPAPRGAESTRGPAGPLAVLEAGRRAIVTSGEGRTLVRADVTVLEEPELRRRLAWRIPRLEFSATPLARAVELFNEHASLRDGERLELGEPSLGGVLLSGTLRADDLESLLRLLEVEFGIRARTVGGAVVLLRE